MSASAKWTPWKLAIALPNCFRVAVYCRHSSNAPSARPRARAPRPMRPPSRVWRNWRKPLLIGPRTFSLGTIASWNTSSRVSEARQPSLSSFLAAWTPGHLGSSGSWPTPTRVALRELVNHDDVGEVVHPRAAQILRPGDPEQAEVGHPLDVVPGEAALEVVATGAGLHDLLGEVAHHVADLEVLLAEVEGIFHGRGI